MTAIRQRWPCARCPPRVPPGRARRCRSRPALSRAHPGAAAIGAARTAARMRSASRVAACGAVAGSSTANSSSPRCANESLARTCASMRSPTSSSDGVARGDTPLLVEAAEAIDIDHHAGGRLRATSTGRHLLAHAREKIVPAVPAGERIHDAGTQQARTLQLPFDAGERLRPDVIEPGGSERCKRDGTVMAADVVDAGEPAAARQRQQGEVRATRLGRESADRDPPRGTGPTTARAACRSRARRRQGCRRTAAPATNRAGCRRRRPVVAVRACGSRSTQYAGERFAVGGRRLRQPAPRAGRASARPSGRSTRPAPATAAGRWRGRSSLSE